MSDDTQHAARNTPRSIADAWFTSGRFTLLLIGMVIVRFPRVVFGVETFFYRDYGLFTYPVAHYFRECFWRGELPLWNPYNSFGVPLLAQWNTSILYPPSLFYLVLPLTWSLAVFNLAHLVFAGLGMYFLARRWTGSQLAAAVAGMGFAFNGLSLHMLMWVSNLAAWAWMPWVVLTVEKAWRGNAECGVRSAESGALGNPQSSILNPLRPLVIAVIAGTMQMLSGAPELILLTWIFLGGMWLAQFFKGEVPRKRMFWRVTIVGVLIAGLTAIQLLPFLELLTHSQRDTSYGDSKWAMPVWGWANFLVPLFHCSPSIIGIFSQTEQQWTSSYYMGIGLMALALVAFWQKRDFRVYGLTLAVLVGIVLAMGENAPIYGWVKRAFPLLGIMRYPIKLVVLTVFALPLLAAFGLRMRDEPVQSDTRSFARIILGTAILFLLLIVAILSFAHRFPLADETWSVTFRSGLSRAVLLIMILGAAWAVTRAQSARTVGLAGLAMLLLVAVDVLTHAPNQNPTLPFAIYEPLDTNHPAHMRLGESRAMEHPQMQAFLIHAATPDALSYYLTLRHMLYLNCNLIDDIPTTSGFFSLELLSAAQLSASLNHGDAVDYPQRLYPKGLADFAGVSRISSADASFAWTNRPAYMPFIFGGQKPLNVSREMGFLGKNNSRLERDVLVKYWGDSDFTQSVWLPATAFEAVSNLSRVNIQITNPKIFPQHCDFDTRADAPAIITIAQAFYPPWHAYVDGKRVPLWEANAAFQALAVPAGQHHVKVIYEDTKFRIGALVSGCSLVILGALWFLGRRTA